VAPCHLRGSAEDALPSDYVISHRFPIAEALQAYDLLLKDREPYLGVVLTYPQPEGETGVLKRRVGLAPAASAPAPEEARGVGLIGGGMFTKNILLPALKEVGGASLRGVATTTGVTAQGLAQKFGFSYATTDYREILEDAAVGSIFITTRHNLHAGLVREALAAGKHVFVEKPLCLSETELEEICRAYDGSRLLMVGFNRRFAPLARNLKECLRNRTTPLVMSYRVNAGYIPADHWVHDPQIGGGRLLGEVCHFIDFLCYLSDSEVSSVSAAGIDGRLGKYRRDDNLSFTLKFADGSVGHILYTAMGSKAFSRERLEVFGEESVGVIEDFRRALIVKGGRTRKIKKFSQDYGYQAEMAAFFQYLKEPGRFAALFESYVISTRATLKAAEALQTGAVVQVAE